MHKDGWVDGPDGVAEPLEAVEFVPLTWFCFVDFELNVLTYCVSATANYDHHCADEDTRMLVSR